MPDVFQIEGQTEIPRDHSYIRSYPYILKYFRAKRFFSEADLVVGAHMVYGWMPTVLELYSKPASLGFAEGAALLSKAKCTGGLTAKEIQSLASIVNNSLVGASKLLHFVAPQSFAIWDSKIYRFMHQQTAHNYRVQSLKNYQGYQSEISRLCHDPRFKGFHKSVNSKVGYSVSAVRAIELIMFLNAPA